MYGSRTDKWHSQNGDTSRPDETERAWDRRALQTPRATARIEFQGRALHEYQDWRDEQAVAADGFGPTDVQQQGAVGRKENSMEIYQGVGEQVDLDDNARFIPDGGLRAIIEDDLAEWPEQEPLADWELELLKGSLGIEVESRTVQCGDTSVHGPHAVENDLCVGWNPAPKRAPVDRKRIEFLLSQKQPLARSGNNPFSKPTEDIRLYDPDSRTRKGMRVG